jgi:hypothetical protein
MAYSKVRWISTLAFLACVGGAHGREEGAKRREWLRWVCERPRGGGGAHVLGGRMRPSASRMRPSNKHMRPSGNRMRPTVFRMCALRKRMCPSDRHMRPSASVCTPQPTVCARSNPDHPTWQRCGSHRGQSKSRFTLSKVNKTLTLIGRTRTLSDVTDGRTHA